MNAFLPRRRFLQSLAGTGALAGVGGLPVFTGGLPTIGAEEVKVNPASVRFSADIEPLVRLLEDTPRDRLLEEMGARIQKGTATYREVLSALLLAGIRNIQPRPVGFKFHAVLVVHSAHMASLNSPDSDRWLPLFWALDQFKSSQARDVAEGDWTMGVVDEKAVPDAAKARQAFTEAMDQWDAPRVDAAVAGLARAAGAQEVFDWFCRYGARDFRDIGHKAIYVANSWRALQTIGWQHAEPVLRSLGYALLEHEQGNPATRDAEQDRPGRRNDPLTEKIRPDWSTGLISTESRAEMLSVLRSGNWEQAADKVVELLNRGTHPQSLWDAFFQSASEMLMRKAGILSLHAGTTTNALHYAWENCQNDRTRRFLMLQNASFLTMFRDIAGTQEGVKVDEFEPAAAGFPLEEVFASISSNRLQAAGQSLAWLKGGGDVKSFIAAAQRLIYLKGTDSHDYKFSSAVFEDYHHLSPDIRDRFLASSVFWLKGSAEQDNPLVTRTREALRSKA
ncbi:MAG: hypothetical protein JWM59_4994 [Verrucomicrobiales bacterium]|nr:hypothetical protein [Verrucomicrobiales bacterium]